jgi:hypothetical protein
MREKKAPAQEVSKQLQDKRTEIRSTKKLGRTFRSRFLVDRIPAAYNSLDETHFQACPGEFCFCANTITYKL